MKLEPENTGSFQTVNAFSESAITISGATFRKSLIVMPDMKPISWQINSFDELTLEGLAELGQYNPDIIILGTGQQNHHLHPDWSFSLLEKGILIECMNNRAACGAYNLILAEKRQVLLALIMEEIKSKKRVTLLP